MDQDSSAHFSRDPCLTSTQLNQWWWPLWLFWWLGKLPKETTWYVGRFRTTWHCWDSFLHNWVCFYHRVDIGLSAFWAMLCIWPNLSKIVQECAHLVKGGFVVIGWMELPPANQTSTINAFPGHWHPLNGGCVLYTCFCSINVIETTLSQSAIIQWVLEALSWMNTFTK